MSVDFVRMEVTQADGDWQMIRDICEGQELDSYLRSIKKPNGAIDEIRTRDYKENAIFYGIAGKTGRGLVGTVFSKAPAMDLAGGLEYVEENIDGGGNGIIQQSRAVVGDVVRYGRCGLWVDFAATDGVVSLADQDRYFATVTHYKPWQIVNWRQERNGSGMKLALVVLKEYRPVVDGFTQSSEKIYRELGIVPREDGAEGMAYRVRVWRATKNEQTGHTEWVVESTSFPTDANGNMLDAIPFTFVGAENNDPAIDRAPMLDLVRVNIGHFRNSADYEDTVFYAGQAQPFLVGATQEVFDMMDAKDFYIGSRKLMPVPEGGSFGFATPDPNPAVRQAMIDKVDLMVGMGASFIDTAGGAKTATEARSDDRTETSELSVIAGNVSQAYMTALGWAAAFQNAGESTYQLHDDFSAITATPEMLTAWVRSWLDGGLPFGDYVDWMKRNGYINPEKTLEQVRTALEEERLAGGAGIDT